MNWYNGKKSEHPQDSTLTMSDFDTKDLEPLKAALGSLNKIEMIAVRKRRREYNFLYTEAVKSMVRIPRERPVRQGDSEIGTSDVGTDSDGIGISFQKMLIILARYKLTDIDNSLSIVEQLHHRQRMARLHLLVSEEVAKTFPRMIAARLRFIRCCLKVQEVRERARPTPEQGAEQESGSSSGGGASGSNSSSALAGLGPTSTTSPTTVQEMEHQQGNNGGGASGSSSSRARESTEGLLSQPEPETEEAKLIKTIRAEWLSRSCYG